MIRTQPAFHREPSTCNRVANRDRAVRFLVRFLGPGLLLLPPAALAAAEASPAEHPLAQVLALASRRWEDIPREIRDYTCTLVKREQVDAEAGTPEQMLVKLRHQQVRDSQVTVPFAVYIKYSSPPALAGREVVYVEGHNSGQLIARRGGQRVPYITVSTDPRSPLAMKGNRYPLTEIGLHNLIHRIWEVGEEEVKLGGEIDVKYFPGARVNNRQCTAIQVMHPIRRSHFRYHLAQIFIDDELQLPIRYASYDWPQRPGDTPPLLEEYTYLDLKLNVGLTDQDFDHRNEAYGFLKDFNP